MPKIIITIDANTPPTLDIQESIKQLHNELKIIGYHINENEVSPPTYGGSTQKAVLEFRQKYNTPVDDSDKLEPWVGWLIYVVALFVNGKKIEFHEEFSDPEIEISILPKDIINLMAILLIIAGNYKLAQKVALLIEDNSRKNLIAEIIPASESGSKSFSPENIYLYKKFLISDEEFLSFSSSKIKVGDIYSGYDPADSEMPLSSKYLPKLEICEMMAISGLEKTRKNNAAKMIIDAISSWQLGHINFKSKAYDKANNYYSAALNTSALYFRYYYEITVETEKLITIKNENGDIQIIFPSGKKVRNLFSSIVLSLYENNEKWSPLLKSINERRMAIDLKDLENKTWRGIWGDDEKALIIKGLISSNLNGLDVKDSGNCKDLRMKSWDTLMLLLGSVLIPLARAETNRALKNYPEAIQDLENIITPYHMNSGGLDRDIIIANDFIEQPFARNLLAEVLLEKAEVEYRSGTLDQESNLVALSSYQKIIDLFKNDELYSKNITNSKDGLEESIKDVAKKAASTLSGKVNFKNIEGNADSGIEFKKIKTKSTHDSLVKFKDIISRGTNPKVYSILFHTVSQKMRIENNINYIGYHNDYIPPWRFQFLIEQAIYFAERAKGVQRDYLNFQQKKEEEEFREYDAQKNINLEARNIDIELARVTQAQNELQSAIMGQVYNSQSLANAKERFENYRNLDQIITDYEEESFYASQIIAGATALVTVGAAIGAVMAAGPVGAAAVAGAKLTGVSSAVGGLVSSGASLLKEELQIEISREQRKFEVGNLSMAIVDTENALSIANAQREVASAGLSISYLQHQASVMRHEYALDTLIYLKERKINSEFWHRLALSMQAIANTYMRYAIEIAFLAEQAYEFEADKQINVIRFDYNQGEIGDVIGADFLLQDLDSLKHDLIVTQRQRQQHVRYVLSMAQEFPAALEELRINGKVNFSVTRQQIERRFPGLFSVRLGTVDLLPIALMNSNRFSLELTHLGSSQTLLRNRPGMTFTDNDPRNPEFGSDSDWFVQSRITAPETAIFSGISRQEASAVFPFTSNGQRNAFEGLGAACNWQIDMSMQDNQVVPGTLADMLITFTLSGYYDADLRKLQEVKRQTDKTPDVITSWLSARQAFPDAFYEFNHTGRMVWQITPNQLTLTGSIQNLQNAGIMLVPATRNAQFNQLQSVYRIDFSIEEDLTLTTHTNDVPVITFKQIDPQDHLLLQASVNPGMLLPNAQISWDFGDGQQFPLSAPI